MRRAAGTAWAFVLLGALLLPGTGPRPGAQGAEPTGPRCSVEPMGAPPTTASTFFLGVPQPDTVTVARHPEGLPGDGRTHGQRVEILRIARPGSTDVGVGSTVIVVPWDYGADCRILPWGGSAAFLEPGRTGLYRLSLRERPFWAGGTPTFDATFASYEPYPWGSGFRHDFERSDGARSVEFDPDFALSAEALFEVFREVARKDEFATREALLDWADRHPDSAGRYPISKMTRYAKMRRANEAARSVALPLAGTWRLEVRIRGGAARSLYLRTAGIPYRPWWDGPAHERIASGAAPEGYTFYVVAATEESALPDSVHRANETSCRLGIATVRASEGRPGSDIRLDPLYFGRCLGENRRYGPEEIRVLAETWGTVRVGADGSGRLAWPSEPADEPLVEIAGERISTDALQDPRK